MLRKLDCKNDCEYLENAVWKVNRIYKFLKTALLRYVFFSKNYLHVTGSFHGYFLR